MPEIDVLVRIERPPGPNRRVTLRYPDGVTIASFSEDDATDMGDYRGEFVHQRCLMQRSGDWVVWFRPDADGTREEFAVEYGTMFRFTDYDPAHPAPTVRAATGGSPRHIGIPHATLVIFETGSLSTQAGGLSLYTSYATPLGDTAAMRVASVTLVAGQRAVISPPTPYPSALGWNVHASYQGSQRTKQNSAPIPFGETWRCPDTGFIVSSAVPPNTYPSTVAYTAELSGGTLVNPVIVKVPHHEWMTGWRWFSKQRPAVRGYDELLARKFIPPLNTKYVRIPVPPEVGWKGPMDVGPIMPGLPTTGGRRDIGFTTDWSGAYILTGNKAAEKTMLAAAEATYTMAFWVRDVDTGAIVDCSRHVRPSFADAWGGRYQIPMPAGVVYSPVHFILDTSHMPDMASLQYMIYDDPFYLECTHAEATQNICGSNGNARSIYPCASGGQGQTRAVAWGFRAFFRSAIMTPEVTPKWLLNKSYWRDKVVGDNLSFVKLYMNNTSELARMFHLFTHPQTLEPFQFDYLLTVMGWVGWTRLFPEWDEAIAWLALPRMALSDVDNAYGWDHRAQNPSYMPFGDGKLVFNSGKLPANMYSNATDAATPNRLKSWAEGFALWQVLGPAAASKDVYHWQDPPWPEDGLVPRRESHYAANRAALASLALAAKAGVAGLDKAKRNHDWLWERLAADLPMGVGNEGWGWTADPDR